MILLLNVKQVNGAATSWRQAAAFITAMPRSVKPSLAGLAIAMIRQVDSVSSYAYALVLGGRGRATAKLQAVVNLLVYHSRFAAE